ncbi:hypothetical protein C8J25_101147 [Sphingomonas faeni]|uniref:DUF1488 family protein n=1 Tax=Sphingomonas faeni TaxID=185950 RepID=A0A2T5UAW7_9SPHN|nr:hypothetical protein [Sphingomonas faeni]PTW48650.1 hypothetical protein C8J25_101147 [Sphingomonas faeni]
MAEDRLNIDVKTLEDNSDLRQVEFEAEVSEERYQLAVQYDVLEALSTVSPEGDAVTIFKQHAEEIAELGVVALARDPDQKIVVISENDLD